MKIPVFEPELGEEELANVVDCVKTGWISGYSGKYIDEFEEKFSSYCGCKYGITTTNCATALQLVLESLEIGKGDEVIVPAFTMMATVAAIVRVGAKPVLVDSEPITWNIATEQIKENVTNRTRVIMPVHIYGHPCEMSPILEIAMKHGLFVIEDAAESHGAEYKGKRTGGLGDAGCFSFYINKIIATGEGGMITTNNKRLAERAKLLKSYATNPSNRFLHEHMGFNYRMCLPIGTKVLVNVVKKWKNKISSGESPKIIPMPIEQISVGDEVLSFDEETGKKEIRKVTGTSTRLDSDLIHLKFSNGNELTLTSNHPIYIHGKGWVESKNVCIGDMALQYNYLALTWRISSIAKRGGKLEDILGKERALRIKTNHSKIIKELRTDPQSGYNTSNIFNTAETHKKQGDTLRKLCQVRNLYPVERRIKISQCSKDMWANPESRIRSADTTKRRGLAVSVAIKRRLQSDPEFAECLSRRGIEAIKMVGRKPTSIERSLIALLNNRFPDTYKYVGDGKFWIENVNPDFINVNGYKKVIEIYSPYWKVRDYGSIAEYQRQRRLLFSKYGWDVLFIEASRKIKNPDEVMDRVVNFTYNPNVVAVTVVSKEKVLDTQVVYNLDIEKNNNFFAYGILVHNTNMQAAVGVGQMSKIDRFVERKREIARQYSNRLKSVKGIALPSEMPWAKNVYWVYGICVAESLRDELRTRLDEEGVETRTFFVPMHMQPCFRKMGLFLDEEYPVAEQLSREGLYLPNSVNLTEEQIDYICDIIKEGIRG